MAKRIPGIQFRGHGRLKIGKFMIWSPDENVLKNRQCPRTRLSNSVVIFSQKTSFFLKKSSRFYFGGVSGVEIFKTYYFCLMKKS